MFREIQGGSFEIIYDSYKCWIPPVPDKSQILFHNLPKEEQYWRRQVPPSNFKELFAEEERIREQEQKKVDAGDKDKVTHLNPILERYRRQEFYRRKWGVWFYRNGVPTYITGHFYWYLNYCKADHAENDGYPIYYEFSRKAFYFRQFAEEDPKSLGYMIIGPRGSGKSQEELACITNNMLIKHNASAALQSKNYEKDAKGVLFKTKLVPLFNALPEFFKPVNSHGSNPETSFAFTRPAIKGKAAKDIKYGPDFELTSYIFPVLPGEKALDSDTAAEIFEDEIGKTEKSIADIYERHKVNLKVVWRNHRKVGLMRKTSTVEKMTEGGTECHKLWKESDPKKKDGNGQTVSKIYRYFISALDTDTSPDCCDIYGNVDRIKANEKIDNYLASIKHDYLAMSSEMRKMPRNESEAFIPDQSKSLFNIQLCTARLNEIRNVMPTKPYVRGNLYWIKEKFGPVWFEPDEHAGRFKFAWFPDEFAKHKFDPSQTKILNNVEKFWGWDKRGQSRQMLKPKNDHLFRIASDPIKYSKTKDPRASKASIHGFRLYDHNVDYGKKEEHWQSHNFIFEYIVRPEDPETSFEDVAMACIFLGCKALPERNVPSLNDYFERNGLEHFLAYPKDFVASSSDIQTNSDDAGYASTTEVIDYYVRRLIAFINRHIGRMPFDDTIEDWMNFDSTNPTPSHATVSSGFCLIHAEKIAEKEEVPEGSIEDWFDEFDNSGYNGTFREKSVSIPHE